MKPKLLITESIHEAGVKLLEGRFDVDFCLGQDRNSLLNVINDYEIIVVKSVTLVNREFLAFANRLKIVGRAGTGVDNIDTSLLKSNNIKFFTVPTGNTVSAAELTIALILNLVRRLQEVSVWVRNKDYRRHLLEGRELSEMNVCILGLGNVGMAVYQRLKPFGCKIVGFDKDVTRRENFRAAGGSACDSMQAALADGDIVSVHVALSCETEGLINRKTLGWFKKGAMLVNTARGKLIDEQALLEALDSAHIAQAAIDVVYPEPPYNSSEMAKKYTNALISHPKVLFTPHIGGSTVDAQKKISLDLANQIHRGYFDN